MEKIMKKFFLTVVALLFATASLFAQKKYDAKEIMGWTQEQVIKVFGEPNDIVEAGGSTVNYNFIYPGIEPFNDTIYSYNDFTISFGNFFIAKKTESGYAKEKSVLLVNSVTTSKDCTELKLPFNLTTNDTLEDVLDICGEPYMNFGGNIIDYKYKKVRVSPNEIGLDFLKDVQRIDIEPKLQMFFENNELFGIFYIETYTLK